MDAFWSLLGGFAIALRPENLLFALAGSVIGTAVGVLPGIGPITGIAILLPLTFKLEPTGAIIMLSAIYYGAMYGGTITGVLLNVPGEGASAVTAIDGYQMARQGRAGAALAIAAIGSFIGGTVATVVLGLRRAGPGERGAELRAARVLRPDAARADPARRASRAARRSPARSARCSGLACRCPAPTSSRARRA